LGPSQNKTPIQLLYIIFEDLSNYKEKVELGLWEFPSFKDCCPLCEGSNCPKRIGYYDRGVMDVSGNDFRIDNARYLCNRKGPKNPIHRTFSLLPHQLIPYLPYTVELTFKVISFWLEGHSIYDVLEYASSLGVDEPLELSTSTLYVLKAVVEKAFDKVVMQGEYEIEAEEALEGFIDVCKGFHRRLNGRDSVGPLAISIDYYCRSGGCFLFGTPSQGMVKISLSRRIIFFSDTQPRYPP
jgi:hypothetical protein